MDEILSSCIAEVNREFRDSLDYNKLAKCVQEIIPLDKEQYKITEVTGTDEKFKCSIKASVENIETFVSNYMSQNGETLRLDKVKNKENMRASRGDYSTIKYYRCKHNTRNEKTREVANILQCKPNRRFSNTNCEFRMITKKIKDNLATEEASHIVVIEWNHNHPTTALQSKTYKDIPIEVKTKIKELFSSGLLPGATHKELLRQLKSECQDDLEFHEKSADRSIIPRRPDINRLYGKFTQERFGTENLSSMYNKLEEKMNALRQKDNNYDFKLQKYDPECDLPFVLVIVTPLMKRVHLMVS